MRARFTRRATLVAMIAGLLGTGLGFSSTNQASAQSITAGTYNIRIAGGNGVAPIGQWDLYNWVETRRFLVFEAINEAQPDFMGFQEAFQRKGPLAVGPTQQESLGELFAETKWTYLSWGAEDANNMNPIIVNTDRFTIVDSGTVIVDMTDLLGEEGWDDYHDLHELFHGQVGEDGQSMVHSLSPLRYVNWVVADDSETGVRVAFLTSHYETFIGGNDLGEEFDEDFQYFSDLVNDSFGFVSEQIVAQAGVLDLAYGDLQIIIGGDFETPDSELSSQKVYEDAGYVETWRFINGDGRRPTQGIDNLFVLPNENLTINESFYDQADYTNGASDHKPLYAVLTFEPSEPTEPTDPEEPREPRDPREPREPRQPREPREPNDEPRGDRRSDERGDRRTGDRSRTPRTQR